MQHYSEGPEGHAAPGELPSAQHEVPAGQARGKSLTPWGMGLQAPTQCLCTSPTLTPPIPQEVEARNEMTFSHFIQFYKNLMFDAQKSVRATTHPLQLITACPQPAQPIPPLPCRSLSSWSSLSLYGEFHEPHRLQQRSKQGWSGVAIWDGSRDTNGDGSGNVSRNVSRDANWDGSRNGNRDASGHANRSVNK